MKKIISLLTILLCMTVIHAQDVSDAYRYAQDNSNGTARFRAMGGAFGALGGDFSAIGVNPAGSVIFSNNQVAISGSFLNKKNKSNYFGTNSNESNNSVDLNQLGGVFIFKNQKSNCNWKKVSLAVNYENVASFDNSLFSAGTNNNSIDKYFLNNANGLELNIVNGNNYYFDELTFQEQQAYLGYGVYVINESPTYNNVTNRSYISSVAPGGNYYQTNSIETKGYNGKLTVNAATQYKDFLMIGINLNIHFTDYRNSSNFFESNNNTKNISPNRTVDKIWFNNNLYTYGSGFSFKIGAILKPIKQVRLGLAYQSPTWYKLNDELSQKIASSGYGLDNNNPPNINTYTNNFTYDPKKIMVYDPYNLQTPGKITGSFAYIFGTKGLISFDYSLKNYSSLAFSPKGGSLFNSLNNSLSSNSREHASEYRVGGEYKIKQFSLRGGYHFEQSPYKNATTIGNLTGYSGGLGYNFGNKKLDLAYSTSKRDSEQQFFSQGLTDSAKINSTNNSITLTFTLEL